MMEEKQQLEDKVTKLMERNEKLLNECSHYRMKLTEALAEVDRIQRQFESEKMEREGALHELKQLRDQLTTSSTLELMRSTLYSGTSGTRSVSPTTIMSTGGRSLDRRTGIEPQPTTPQSSIHSPLGTSSGGTETLHRQEHEEEP